MSCPPIPHPAKAHGLKTFEANFKCIAAWEFFAHVRFNVAQRDGVRVYMGDDGGEEVSKTLMAL